MPVDSRAIARIIADCAQKHLVPYFNTLRDDQITLKDSAGDIVTQADIEMEENLVRELRALYPDAVYIGEESFDPDNRDALKAPHIFVIDPLDGTRAFREGRHGFAVLVASIEDGVLTQSWLHAPLMQETVYAEKDRGVFLNSVQVQKAKTTGQNSTGHYGPEHRPEIQEMGEKFKRNGWTHVAHTHACMDFLNFVKGDVDVILYQNCYPWDILPGVLIVHEMGGHGALLYDEKDLMTYAFHDIHQPTLYARSRQNWRTLKKMVLGD